MRPDERGVVAQPGGEGHQVDPFVRRERLPLHVRRRAAGTPDGQLARRVEERDQPLRAGIVDHLGDARPCWYRRWYHRTNETGPKARFVLDVGRGGRI